ncbi:MAG TPA: hypothetical protein PLY93_05255 [Turneriella sp.]|nr:hypothetical protein [Turneriella sp.]
MIRNILTGLVFFGTAAFQPFFAASLYDALKSAAKNCTVDLRYARLSACANGEDAAVKAAMDGMGVAKALPDLAAAFANKDEKLSATAASYLYRAKDYLGDIIKNPKLVSAKTVDTLIKGLKDNQSYVSSYASQITTVLATLKKKDAALFAVLDKHKENATRNDGYRWAMYQGRLRVFGRIQKASRDTKHEYLADAALNAPEYMYDYSDRERKKICEWEKGFLKAENPRHEAYAARVLVLRCLGDYIDLVLDRAEELKNEGQLAHHALREALTNFTFTCKEYMGQPATGSVAQCARREVLLQP